MSIIHLEEYLHIYVDKSFQKELLKCLSGFPNTKHFNEWFAFSLSILDDPERNFLLEFPKRFEQIEENIYSMRYKGKKNIRILFCKSQGLIQILSCAFIERNKSDYDLAKTKVRDRKKYY